MHPGVLHLVEVQRLDQKIAALQAELASIPKRIRELDAKLTGARNGVAAAKEAHTNALKERKKFELDAEQWRDRAKKFRSQSSAVKTNEAYRALQHEIANADEEIAKAEDRTLEQMMAVEETERGIAEAELRLKNSEANVAADRKEIETVQSARKKDLETALADRATAIAPVDEDLRELYARIAKRHEGLGLAEAAHEQCKGCGMRLLPHVFEEIRRPANEEIFRCESCGKILYASERAVEAAPGGF